MKKQFVYKGAECFKPYGSAYYTVFLNGVFYHEGLTSVKGVKEWVDNHIS